MSGHWDNKKIGIGMTGEEDYLDPSGLKSQCSYSYASSLKVVRFNKNSHIQERLVTLLE
uniref:Uncharacterized protein n=1 Tax=Wolbachia endosymbiont of Aleurodicus dispersus TaxID=1288877 RepID=A0A3B0J8P6_9RICK